jgi:hypothetical protein
LFLEIVIWGDAFENLFVKINFTVSAVNATDICATIGTVFVVDPTIGIDGKTILGEDALVVTEQWNLTRI